MSQPKRVHALNIPIPARKDLDPDTQAYFAKCDEKIGFVPNVLLSYAFNAKKLRGFLDMRSEEHTSELQSLMRISYAVFCLKKKRKEDKAHTTTRRTLKKHNTSQLDNNAQHMLQLWRSY